MRNLVSLVLVGSLLVVADRANGADIIWFSASDIEADAGFVDLLSAAGHDVTRVPEENPLTAMTIETLNDSDLVITSRSVNSGSFDGSTNMPIWNEQITAPMMAMSAYIIRNNRLGWVTGDSLPDLMTPSPLMAADPSHPVFSGVSFAEDGVTTANEYNEVIDRGISTPTTPPIAGGEIIATIPAIENGFAIAEWPAGLTVTDESGLSAVLAGPRYFFAGGSREADGAGVPTAGVEDLTQTGEMLFLNTVDYILDVEPPVPGDFNDDRVVDENDFFVLSNNLGAGIFGDPVGRTEGDMNFDGQVDLDDFDQFKELFPAAFAQAQAIPEPSTLALVGSFLALLAVCRLRKQGRRVE